MNECCTRCDALCDDNDNCCLDYETFCNQNNENTKSVQEDIDLKDDKGDLDGLVDGLVARGMAIDGAPDPESVGQDQLSLNGRF